MALEIPKAKLKSFVRHVVPGECYKPTGQQITQHRHHILSNGMA